MSIRELAAIFVLEIVAAIVIPVLGSWAAKIVQGISEKIMKNDTITPNITSFTGGSLSIALLAFLIRSAPSQPGIQAASITAVITAAGLAAGLTLQGSFANLAAGILMIK